MAQTKYLEDAQKLIKELGKKIATLDQRYLIQMGRATEAEEDAFSLYLKHEKLKVEAEQLRSALEWIAKNDPIYCYLCRRRVEKAEQVLDNKVRKS